MIEITMTCTPFSSQTRGTYRLAVDDDGTVRVWDSVAGHYTVNHILSVRSLTAARRMAGLGQGSGPKAHIPAAGCCSGRRGQAECGRWSVYETGDHAAILTQAAAAYRTGGEGWCKRCLAKAAKRYGWPK